VIDLKTLLSGDLPAWPLLLTFDDAFCSSFEVIRDVLAPRGLPSVFFINPDIIKEGAISLDSVIAWSTSQADVGHVCKLLNLPTRATVGEVILNDMAQLSAAERSEVRDHLLKAYGPPDLGMRAPLISASDIAKLGDLGAEVGNHTATHVHCRSLTKAERETEIIGAKAQLEELTGQRVRSFSVPYGHSDDLSDPVLETLRASGHEAIFLVHARSNIRRPAKDIWYRVSLHDEAPGKLTTKLRLKPLLRTAKHLIKT